MAKKKLIFEVEEGCTDCDNCPFYPKSLEETCVEMMVSSACIKYNLTTLKLVEDEEI